ncbi:WD domain-containing protein [Cladophialophora immunda]|nr:WD domain-containing protein [Cladophialophora immunda]
MAKSSAFDPGHHDRVTVLHANFNGTRILTASIDHRIKVWERNPKTGERTLLDTFTAHDSDVRDAKFLHPTLGTHLASIGNDLKFHLWSEDASQPPRGGHRFRRIATIASTPRVPFVSMDVKTLATDHVSTFLALIDRQGLLSVYEPSSPDDLREWALVDCFNVCAGAAAAASTVPGRGEETSFKVRFDPNPTPLAYVNSVSDDRDQLGLVVCALNEVKIYRSVVPSQSGSGVDVSVGGIGMGIGGGTGIASAGGNASHRVMFYEALRLPVHPALVRDVAWAPFSVRGTDRIATACKDGAVRIFELGVAESPDADHGTGNDNGHRNNNYNNGHPARNGAEQHSTPTPTRSMTMQQQQRHQQQQSSLTTQIAGRHGAAAAAHSSPSAGAHTANPARSGYAFPYITTISSGTTLSQAHTDAWSLAFDSQGQVLMSTGSDGVTKVWRKSVLGGQWMMFAGQEITEDEDETDEDEGEGDEKKHGAETE